jgi:hypothetical protein
MLSAVFGHHGCMQGVDGVGECAKSRGGGQSLALLLSLLSSLLSSLFALAFGLSTTAARAEGWRGALAVASDQVQRGISVSEGRAAWMLDVARTWDSGWSLSAGASGPSYPVQGGQIEFGVSADRAWQIDNDWLTQWGVSHYEVLGEARARFYRYNELHASLAWRGRLTLALSASPDTARFVGNAGVRRGTVLGIELAGHQRLWGPLAFDAGVGYVDFSSLQAPGYGYGSVGLSYGLGPVQAFVSFIDSRARRVDAPRAKLAGPRWVATVIWHF